MLALYFLKGLLVGFSIAAPVGPIGVLCIRRSLAQGRLIGFATGLGAATADAAYGAVAGFGLTAISGFLTGQVFWLRLIGGLFLCGLGWKTCRARVADETGATERQEIWGAYLSTVFLTLTNPTTILSFVAVFAGLGLAASQHDYGSATAMVGGVFLGSAFWWLLLSQVVGAMRTQLGARWMRRINWLSGGIILAFGVAALFSLRG